MGKIFGTDGIRGRFGDKLVNPEFAYRLGAALGTYLNRPEEKAHLNAVIGRDTRASGPQLVDAVVRGLNQHNVYVHNLGIVPTPAIAQCLLERQADIGISITASHNPAEDNGYKLFNSEGVKLAEAEEGKLEELIESELPPPENDSPGKSYLFNGADFYINYLRSLMDQNCMSGWKIVLDLANGAACETSPAVFGRWGAEIIRIGDNPDGENINLGVGSEHPEKLARTVVETGAALGIGHDGDADRLVVCDEQGGIVDGDVLLGLFGLYALRSNSLRTRTLVTTIQSNSGLDRAIRAAGGTVERTPVGDRNVALRMREIGSNLGGESSGHIIFSDFATTGDGLLAAIKLIDLLCKVRRPLSELKQEVELFPQAVRNLRVKAKEPLEDLEHIKAAETDIRKELGEEGRVLVRYSGTEPKIRLLVEASGSGQAGRLLDALDEAVRRDLDVIDD
ncbi:MAG: phosphoglucosamine mutase [Opitutales bacterium]